MTLAPNASRTIVAHFDPSSPGDKAAILEILAPDPTGVDLRGSGTGGGVNESFSTPSAGTPPGFTAVRGGPFSVSGGQLRMSSCTGSACSGPNGNLLVHGFPLPASFTLAVKGIATATSSPVNDFSVVFNFQDAGNYVYASFNERDTPASGSGNDVNTNGVFRVVGGVRTQIADFAVTTPPGGSSATLHAIRIERNGTNIQVFRGSTQLATVNDGAFSGGRAGVGSFNDQGRFDDFVITPR